MATLLQPKRRATPRKDSPAYNIAIAWSRLCCTSRGIVVRAIDKMNCVYKWNLNVVVSKQYPTKKET